MAIVNVEKVQGYIGRPGKNVLLKVVASKHEPRGGGSTKLTFENANGEQITNTYNHNHEVGKVVFAITVKNLTKQSDISQVDTDDLVGLYLEADLVETEPNDDGNTFINIKKTYATEQTFSQGAGFADSVVPTF